MIYRVALYCDYISGSYSKLQSQVTLLDLDFINLNVLVATTYQVLSSSTEDRAVIIDSFFG